MKDLWELKYIFGIKFIRSKAGILMHQKKQTLELIAEIGLSVAKSTNTPKYTNVKLTSVQYDEYLRQSQSICADLLVDQIMY